MYDSVHPQKIIDALKWLIQHNKHYYDVKLNNNWAHGWNDDDPELWQALLSAAERRGTPVLLSATVSDNSGSSPQVAAPRRPREINQSTQRCSLLDQIHTLSCTKQK